MGIYKKREILPTIKINPTDEENAFKFKEEMLLIVDNITDISTKFGDKSVLTAIDKDGKRFNIFLNTMSINNLIEAFGENSDRWITKEFTLKKEKDSYYNKDALVVYPSK